MFPLLVYPHPEKSPAMLVARSQRLRGSRQYSGRLVVRRPAPREARLARSDLLANSCSAPELGLPSDG